MLAGFGANFAVKRRGQTVGHPVVEADWSALQDGGNLDQKKAEDADNISDHAPYLVG